MTGGRLPDAREVSRMLAANMPALVAELLPAAKRHGNEAVIGSIRGEPGRSMSICIAGPRAGLWADFSAGMKGDALDLAGALLGLDKAAAWRWGLRRLGYTPPGDAPGTQAARPPPPPPDTTQQDQAAAADAERRQRQARAIFAEAQPLTPACPPALYGKGRSLDLAELGRVPRALRYHPALWCSEAGTALPAMVGAIMSLDGEMQGVHRIWLQPGASPGTWHKATLARPKKALGSVTGGCIPIWRGSAATPLREAPEGSAVVLCEGIEDALAVALLAPELRVLAVVSLANMASVMLPDTIASVILAADNDAPGSPAALALQRAVDTHTAAGRDVRIARSPSGKDFADALAASTEGDA